MDDVRGYIREIIPRYPALTQRKAMEAHSIKYVVQESKKKATGTRADLLRMASAPGRVFAVLHLFLLADPTAKRKRGGTRRDLWQTIDAIEKGGGIIWELSTGLRTDDRRQRDTMMRNAVEALAVGRHKTNGADKRGRPPYEPSEDETRRAKAIWRDLKEYPRWEDAVAALKQEVPRFTAARAFKAWKGRR